jgi:HlyD family secretion protein
MSRGSLTILLAGLLLSACGAQGEKTWQGWVEAEQIFVGPDVAGRIETLSVREGDKVEKDAPLFTLDSDLQRADLAMQQAGLTNAQQAYQRAQVLLKTAAGTQKALEDAEAALRTAQARVNSSQTQLDRRKIASPVTGSAQEVYYRVGEMVPQGRPVVSLLPPGNMKIRFFVPQAVLPKLTIGDAVHVTCDGCDGDLVAHISFIASSAEYTPPVIYSLEERAKLVFLIEARPDLPDKFRVGQPITVVPPEKAR